MSNDEEVKVSENEMTDEQKEAICYHSKLLNKYFDSYEELVAAEAPVKKAQKEKEEKAELKRAETSVVESAINAYEEGKVVCNNLIAEAYQEYKNKVEAAEKDLDLLRATADERLSDYLDSHPGTGFHYTFRSKDGKIVHNYSYLNKRYNIFDNYNRFVEAINRLWDF